MNLTHCKTLKLNRLDTSQCQTAVRIFNRCRKATDIEISKLDIANMLTLSEAFLECNALETLDISGWICPKNTSLHSTWNNCNKLRQIKFNENWTTQNVRYFSCTFYATAFEKLDLSSWKFDKMENASVMLGCMTELLEIDISSFISKAGLISSDTSVDKSIFVDTTNISKITVGDGLTWNDIRDMQNETAPSPVSPSGKWYSATSGKAYDSAGLPDRTADTYVSDTTLLPMKAFAVYSDTDKSLNLYKRHINEIPSVSDTYNERAVIRIYFDFEDSNPICDGNFNSKYKRGYFHDVEEYVTNINIIDAGIKPINISGMVLMLLRTHKRHRNAEPRFITLRRDGIYVLPRPEVGDDRPIESNMPESHVHRRHIRTMHGITQCRYDQPIYTESERFMVRVL